MTANNHPTLLVTGAAGHRAHTQHRRNTIRAALLGLGLALILLLSGPGAAAAQGSTASFLQAGQQRQLEQLVTAETPQAHKRSCCYCNANYNHSPPVDFRLPVKARHVQQLLLHCYCLPAPQLPLVRLPFPSRHRITAAATLTAFWRVRLSVAGGLDR